jgi:gluconate 2-dehydrogenase gamma chain
MWILSEQLEGFFSDQQQRRVAVLFNAIIPGDPLQGVPNAEEVGAVNFIHLLLARNASVYADIPEWQKRYVIALVELDYQSKILFQKSLENLSREEATFLIARLELGQLVGFSQSLKQAETFDMLRRHCIQGCFCDPRWGGNTNGNMWKWFGYLTETK